MKRLFNVKKINRLLSLFILFVMMINSTIVFADSTNLLNDIDFSTMNNDHYKKDGIVYTDNTMSEIVSYEGDKVDLKIPSSVKRIGKFAFKDKGLKNIVLNDGLEIIEDEAFSNNSISGELLLPKTIKKIGNRAFADNAINTIDLSLIDEDVKFGNYVFQDNKIVKINGLENMKIIPKGMFMNNNLSEISLGSDLKKIEDKAFLSNELKEVDISSKDAIIGMDVFAANGQYVRINTENKEIKSEASIEHLYGHVKNPVDITVSYLAPIIVDDEFTGEYKRIVSDKFIKFDARDNGNLFALNQESVFTPDFFKMYELDDRYEDGVVRFTPDKNNYHLNVYYKKARNPEIVANNDAIKDLLSIKKEGDNISKEELLSLVKAFDGKGNDISKEITISPNNLTNILAKEYDINYSVIDSNGLMADYKITLPINIDPLKIKIANTEWQLEDFEYNNNTVIGLSEKGKIKAKQISGLAIPHINPYTMETIEVVDFSGDQWSSNLVDYIVNAGDLMFGDSSVITHITNYSFKELPLRGNFPKLDKVAYIGDGAFEGTELSGQLSDMNELKYIGVSAFYKTNVSGSLPSMENIEIINDWAFLETDIEGKFPNLQNLRYIGEASFGYTKINEFPAELKELKVIGKDAFMYLNEGIKALPKMPKLERIEHGAFFASKIHSELPEEYPSLKYIGDWAFSQTDVFGRLFRADNLEYIGSSSFYQTYISGFYDEYPSLITIDDYAFYESPISNLPIADNLEYIGHGAFYYSEITDLPETYMSLEYIGDYAFMGNNISSELTYMPNLIYIGEAALYESKVTGELLEKTPKLEHVGNWAFFKVEGIYGKMPNNTLKHLGLESFYGTSISDDINNFLLNVEYIGEYSLGGTNIYGEFPSELPKVTFIGKLAFYNNIYVVGDLPQMPNIKEIEEEAFRDSGINKTGQVLYIDNDAKIHDNAFAHSYGFYMEQVKILTKDGGPAYNTQTSLYHVVNPYSIKLTGIDMDTDEVLFNDKIVMATDVGTGILIEMPKIPGYVNEGYITIPKNQISNDRFTLNYQSYENYAKEQMIKNKFSFSLDSSQEDKKISSENIINSRVSFNNVGEETINNGEIIINYNPSEFKEVSIAKVRGINNIIDKKNGEIVVVLDNPILSGTEIAFPIYAKLESGLSTENKYFINASLKETNNIVGFDKVGFYAKYTQPEYESKFVSDTKEEVISIVTTDLNEDYGETIAIKPNIKTSIRSFKEIVVEYDKVVYDNKNGNKDIAVLTEDAIQNGWEYKDGKYIYTIKNYKGNIEIPNLELYIKNPSNMTKAISINSKITIDPDVKDDTIKLIELKDTNKLNIFVELRGNGVYIKYISNPHVDGRHSKLYDNEEERNEEYLWHLTFLKKSYIKELKITDYNLDERMYYSSIDPNGDRVLFIAYDKDGKELVKKSINEKYIFDEVVAHHIDRIELYYYDIKAEEDGMIQPIVGSRLKNTNESLYNESNPESNIMYNYMDVEKVDDEGNWVIGTDYAYIHILKGNKLLRTDVDISTENISYGENIDAVYGLRSEDYIKILPDKFNYTVLIEPGFEIENIELLNEFYATYEISKTENNYTKIDFSFDKANILIENEEDFLELVKISSRASSIHDNKFKTHGILYPSDEYIVYHKGKDIIENIDTTIVSYVNQEVNIENQDFFYISKMIGNDDYIGTDIKLNPGSKFFYRFEIINTTLLKRENLDLIDILPYKGDVYNSQLNSYIDLEKIENLKLPAGYSIEFYNKPIDINADYVKSRKDVIENMKDLEWSKSPSVNTSAIRIKADEIRVNEEVIIDIPMIVDKEADVSSIGNKAYNSFNYKYSLLTKEAASNVVSHEIKIDAPPIDIKLRKISHFNNEIDGVIKDVPFGLFDRDNKLVRRAFTDTNGEIVFKDVEIDNYTLKELDVPMGYERDNIEIEINAIDMLNTKNKILDLGDIVNNRKKAYNVLFKNVEILDDVNLVKNIDVKNIYSRSIKGTKFKIVDMEDNLIDTFIIDTNIGYSKSLDVGKYKLIQDSKAEDNGLTYKHNHREYVFEIDKFGNIYIDPEDGDYEYNLEKINNNIIYFPNTVDYKTSNIIINKKDQNGNLLDGAEFILTNTSNGDIVRKISDNGVVKFNDVKPGLYKIEETKAPKGYIKSDKIEIIDVPFDRSKTFNLNYINHKLKVNLYKYKIIAENIKDRNIANDIAAKTISNTGGNIIVVEDNGLYHVREVWQNNIINVNGVDLITDENGSILDIEEFVDIEYDTILNIKNKSSIKGHYERLQIEEVIKDYTLNPDFDGVIDIDLIVKPLVGSIYVSKYVIDDNDLIEGKNPSFTNGSKYTLYVDKGNGFEKLKTEEINNSNYLVFKDLDPNYDYKVVEAFVPEGQEESKVKEQNVYLNKNNGYTATVIFRNYIPKKAASLTINKIDGDTKKPIKGVMFELVNRNGDSLIKTTNSQGKIVFDELKYDLAPYKLIEIQAAEGYRLNSKSIEITEEMLDLGEEIEVLNFKKTNTPETGTLGKLPFIILSSIIILAGVSLLRKQNHENYNA